MEAPPDYGDPYQGLLANTGNPGSVGVAFAWDGLRYFWGTVVNEAWTDLNNTINGGFGV
jgi:hypothetical protein